jgi:5-hydroxyisourate hydrolase-like protein (transthyretin family)
MPKQQMRYTLSSILIAAIVIVAASGANCQSASPTQKATGSISGHIIVDGKAAAGIVVAAFSAEGIRRVPTAQVKTDSEGSFKLGGLTAGTYQVAILTGNLTSVEPNAESPFSSSSVGASKDVLLSAGEDVSGIDLRFARGGVITGRVTDADNKPIVEETITLHPVQDGRSTRMRAPIPIGQMYQTDDRGVYRIYGLLAGKYKVSVGRNATQGFIGSPYGFYPLTYYPDVVDANKAEIVEILANGEATNIDIRVNRHEATYSVTGRIIDGETGTPIGGTNVTLMTSRGAQGFSSVFTGTPTGADGKFNLMGLASGRYGVYVSSDNSTAGVYSDPVYFDVVDKDVSGLEIKATQGSSISGTIAGENIDLRDVLAQLPELQISAMVFPRDMRVTESTIRSGGRSKIEADGSFQINGLRPGRAQISLSNRDASQRPTIVRIEKDGMVATQGFEIAPGQSVAGVRVVVAFGNGVIRGTVKFEGGTLPDGYQPEISCWREGTRSFGGGANVDARGRFVISKLAPATYECTLQMLPFGPTRGQPPPKPQKQFVNVVNGAEVELNFVVDLSAKEVGP